MVNVNFQWYRESIFNFKVILFWSWGHLRVKSRSIRSNRVGVVTWKRWDNSAADFIQHVEGLKSRIFPTNFFLDFHGRSWTAWSKEKIENAALPRKKIKIIKMINTCLYYHQNSNTWHQQWHLESLEYISIWWTTQFDTKPKKLGMKNHQKMIK